MLLKQIYSMAQTDFVSGLVSAKSLINKIAGAIALVGLLTLLYSTGWGWTIVVIAVALILVVNSMCIVMPGNAGYLIVLGRLINKPIQSGLRFVVPFISSVTEVDVRLQKHEDTNTMKTADLRDITLKYVLNFEVDKNYVHLLHAHFGENDFVSKALCPWLDAVMTQIVASKKYEDINGRLADLSSEIETAYLNKVNLQCRNIVGMNIFSNMSVAIIDVQFDEEFTKSVSELAKAEKDLEVVKAKGEQLVTSEKAQAEAIKIKADAEAEAMRIKGASENEVRERLGEILKAHPELIKEVLAKNFPKVYGSSVNPMMTMDDILNA